MSKTNIEYLRELLTTDEQREWLEYVENDLKDAKDEVKQAESEVEDLEQRCSDYQDEVRGLERKIEEMEGKEYSINTGIGTIRYECEGSLDQELLMEAIAELIKEQGVKGLLDQVRGTWGV